jgi:hypothetical protein
VIARRKLLSTLLTATFLTCLSAADESPTNRTEREITIVGTCYTVNQDLLPEINAKVARIRAMVRNQREHGKIIAYLSTPIGAYGVGYTPLNIEIANYVTIQYQKAYKNNVWILNPATVQLPQKAQGADYMYLWTQVLAGADGLGDFDLLIMTGPTDVLAYFRQVSSSPSGNSFDVMDNWISGRAKSDENFRSTIVDDADRLRKFRAFYGLGASAALSHGAHDEWNIFVRLNHNRRLRDGNPASQVPIYFDGRILTTGEMETQVSPGPVCP